MTIFASRGSSKEDIRPAYLSSFIIITADLAEFLWQKSLLKRRTIEFHYSIEKICSFIFLSSYLRTEM